MNAMALVDVALAPRGRGVIPAMERLGNYKPRWFRAGSAVSFISESVMTGFKAGVALYLDEAHSSVRDMLRLESVEGKIGRIDRFTMLADAIENFQSAAAVKP